MTKSTDTATAPKPRRGRKITSKPKPVSVDEMNRWRQAADAMNVARPV